MRFLGFMVLLAACSSADPTFLSVDLRTDYLPGIEVAEVDIAVFRVDTATGPSALRTIETNADLLMGIRAATFDNVASGEYRVRAILRDPAGTEVARRDAVLSIGNEPTIVTVVITRDCQPVVCPGDGGDPSFTECLGGRCVPPDCTPETPERCGVACGSDSECSVESDCAASRCIEGTCFSAPAPNACMPEEYCDAELGCIPGVCRDGMEGAVCRPATSDCDAPELCDENLQCPEDVNVAPGTPCSDFNFCSDGAVCGPCDEGGSCDTGNPCEVGTTDCSSGSPVCVASVAPAGVVCRATATPCDEPELCDGVTTLCPPNEAPTADCSRDFPSAGTFDYEVPPGCTSISARLWGAGGGTSGSTNNGEAAAGFATGTFDTTPGETLTIFVGAPGEAGNSEGGRGGEPGGGDGGGLLPDLGGGGGGGFSAISTASEITAESAILVAGGGGGSGLSTMAGAGGGDEGQPAAAGGGTQSEGGTGHLTGGDGEAFLGGDGAERGGGGGGGGFFGGGGGDDTSGGGGSGYASELVRGPLLIGGSRAMPGNVEAGDRSGAGGPASFGSVSLRCR
ncbi:MAG: glycine-rich protein [Polyangiales bacterium]